MISLTVYFCDPFWVGLFELTENGKLQVSKVTFGAEPKDYEVFDFIIKNYFGLNFGKSNDLYKLPAVVSNPKRRLRLASKQIRQGVSTNSQLAVKFDREQTKTDRKKASRDERERIKIERFAQKQQKTKDKRRGH